MPWHYIFLLGALVGALFLLLASGDASGFIFTFPDYRWDIDMTKHLFSLFIATILMMGLFWYYA